MIACFIHTRSQLSCCSTANPWFMLSCVVFRRLDVWVALCLALNVVVAHTYSIVP